jgi:KaiC/GvpD/RAD55 family RecA-like ATPase
MSDLPPELSESIAAGRLQLLWFADIAPQLRAPGLVKGLLSESAMSVMYGRSGSGKTFLALDLALHIALGQVWFGRRTSQGGVIYLAAEGGRAAACNRVAAFSLNRDAASFGDFPPFAAIPASADLLDPETDTKLIIERIEEAKAKVGQPVRLLVIDTLSRVMAGGNENAPEDMTGFVGNIDRIRAGTGVHALVIHHTGKDEARGARGHSSLRAAADTEFEVTHDETTGVRMLKVTKQRDLSSEGAKFPFQLRSVELGTDEDGDPLTSCVVDHLGDGDPSANRKKGEKVPPGARRALELLKTLLADRGEAAPASNHIPSGMRVVPEDAWRQACYAGQISESEKQEAKQKAFARAASSLVNAGHVGKWNENIWLV